MWGGILAVLLVMAMTTDISAAQNSTSLEMGSELMKKGPVDMLQSATKEGNSSYYIELINAINDQYSEDLGYSSDILDEFVKGNITNREALVATISISTLTSQTKSAFDQIEPPEEYVMYHFYMQTALEYLNEYFWNMAKFYETESNQYAIRARETFNLSIFYYEKSIEEHASVQRSAAGN